MYCVIELFMHRETNLKVRNVVPDIAMYLGDKLERLSTFHGMVIIFYTVLLT